MIDSESIALDEKWQNRLNEIARLAAIGDWWLKTPHSELYLLVEVYLTKPCHDPYLKDAYDDLVAWYRNHPRPDGTPPLPVPDEMHPL